MQGKIGESLIAKWVINRGNSVLPVYEIEANSGKGPQFFTKCGQFVAPDILLIPSMKWIEAKHKTVFSWHRITRRWVTGIDIHHYEHYQRVREISTLPVWLLFLHRSNKPDQRDIDEGCPDSCPVGLFGNSLDYLVANENHRHRNHGKYGMVYWARDKLKLLARLEDIIELENQS